MKTFDRKDVFTVVNAEKARSYINKDGFFADTLSALNKLVQQNCFEILDDVNQLQDFPFISYGKESLFFLPADKVKEVEEKKYRPFKTLEEFRKTFNQIDFGQPLQIRHKEKNNEVFVGIFNDYQEENDVLITISLGGWLISPITLFNIYEVFDDKTEDWQPFGVEVEE